MRRRHIYLIDMDSIISQVPGCLFLGLIPVIAILACTLLYQTADLLAGQPVPAGSRFTVTGYGGAAAVRNTIGTNLAPARRQRRPTPTPATLARMIGAVTGRFGDPSPTPVSVRTRALVAAAIPVAPTPTPGPIDTPTPTFTPTLPPATVPPATVPPPSPTVPPTASPTPVVPQVSAASEVNVRSGPGTSYPIVGSLAANSTMPVTGRNQDSSWWQVRQANGQSGWVASWVVEARDVAGLPVAPAPPLEEQPAPVSVPEDTAGPPPVPSAEFDYLLAEFYNSPTTNSFLTIYVAIVDPKEIPVGDMKVVGTRLDHDLTYESPLSTWFYEGYSAPGAVIKSGNVKFEPPGGIETTSWVLHLADAHGNRMSDDIPFDVDANNKQWYFIRFKRKF